MNAIKHRLEVWMLCIGILGATIVQATPKNPHKKLHKRADELASIIRNENRDMNTGVQLQSLRFEIVEESECIAETGERVSAAAEMTKVGDTGDKHVCIKLNQNLKKDSIALQSFTILHELAHAHDKHLWDTDATNNTTFDCYPVLKNDVDYCLRTWQPTSPVMDASEWHAEWQASQWIKKYAVKRLAEVKRFHRKKKKYEERVGIQSVAYPPAEIVLKWLAE